MLPGKGFAFQNNSEKHLRFELDFVDSENYEIIEPQLKHVTRQGTRIMKIVPPGECHFVATLAQKQPGFSLEVGVTTQRCTRDARRPIQPFTPWACIPM
mmetsp:Transcript_102869/g.294929  ORF Transcript_102869/g.294929 Transcript_102869/m.294929 type:complete len:99 (-) Transcript_102869:376-672(-)